MRPYSQSFGHVCTYSHMYTSDFHEICAIVFLEWITTAQSFPGCVSVHMLLIFAHREEAHISTKCLVKSHLQS